MRNVQRLLIGAVLSGVLAGCQTTAGGNAGTIADRLPLAIEPLGGEFRAGALPAATANQDLPRPAAFSLVFEIEDKTVVGRAGIQGQSEFEILSDGKLSRIDYIDSIRLWFGRKDWGSRRIDETFTLERQPFLREVTGQDGKLHLVQSYEINAAALGTRSKPEVRSAALTLINLYSEGAYAYRLRVPREQVEVGRAVLFPQTVDELLVQVETEVLPAIVRGNANGGQMAWYQKTRSNIAHIRAQRDIIRLSSDVRVRGARTLNGIEYIEVGGPYSLSAYGSETDNLWVRGDYTVLVEPGSGLMRTTVGTLVTKGRAGDEVQDFSSSFRADYVPLQRQADHPSHTGVASANQSERQVPFAISWNGWQELLLGELTYTQNGGSGEIRAAAGGTVCKGRWQYLSGKYGTAESPKGIWSIACANGKAASGTYKSPRLGAGTGVGTDAEGNRVRVTFGKG